MRILAVSGSLRTGSHNTSLLRALREEAPEGVEIELWDGLADIKGVEDLAWNIRAYMVNMVRKSPKEKVRGKRRWPK